MDPDPPAQRGLSSLRDRAAGLAARRAAAIQDRSPRGAVRWFRLAARLAPRFGNPDRRLFELYRALDDRWGAYAAARRAVTRFPHSSDAWMLAADAAALVYRQAEALTAYEQALVIEERADAALAAAALYSRAGRHAEAAARFARAYAAGGGVEALRQNAEALARAGDEGAADQAMKLFRELSSRAGTG